MIIYVGAKTIDVRLSRHERVDPEALRVSVVPLARFRGALGIKLTRAGRPGSGREVLAVWLGRQAFEVSP